MSSTSSWSKGSGAETVIAADGRGVSARGFPWEDLGIDLAILFGSTSRGEDSAGSDVDLAFHLREPYDPMARLRIAGEACSRLGRDDVDVVILNEALAAQPLLERLLGPGLDDLASVARDLRARSWSRPG